MHSRLSRYRLLRRGFYNDTAQTIYRVVQATGPKLFTAISSQSEPYSKVIRYKGEVMVFSSEELWQMFHEKINHELSLRLDPTMPSRATPFQYRLTYGPHSSGSSHLFRVERSLSNGRQTSAVLLLEEYIDYVQKLKASDNQRKRREEEHSRHE